MEYKSLISNLNKHWSFILIALVALAILLAACSSETPVAEQPPPEQPEAPAAPEAEVEPPAEPETEPEAEAPEISQPIARWNAVSEQGNWVLLGYGDALNTTVVEPGTYVTVNFSSTDDQVNGSAGCNNYFTTYTADHDGNVTINGPVGSTMMACETGMEQEALYLGALETVTNYTVTEKGRLLLDYDSGAGYAEQMVFIQGTPLVDTVWVLTAYGDFNDPTPAEAGVVTTAEFSTDGILNGNAGCNDYSAGYQVQDTQITIGLPTTNLMACEKGMEQEQAFLSLLEAADSYRTGMNALEITSADGTKFMRFSANHLPLENVRWLLASINGQALPEDVSANVLFTPADSPAAQGEENSVNGSAGCNTFFGSYTAAGDTLVAGPFGLTQMMCEEEAMQVEQSFLAGLESVQGYQITLNQLIINTATRSLLLYADHMPLEGPKWVLTGRGTLDNPQPPIEGALFTANFGRQTGMPSGVKSGGTGCNDYSATYFATADEIKVNLPQTSQNECSDAQKEAEQGYFLGLNAARDYRILGNEMQVFYDEYVLIFVGSYPEAETGPLTILDGTSWWLNSIDTFLVAPGSEVTIDFAINPDGKTGTIGGSGGCNTYSAEITGVFALGPINASQSLCDIPEGVMEQEAAYYAVLQNANGVWIEGDTLRITTNLETLYYSDSGPEPVQPLPIVAVIEAPSEGLVGELITFDGSGSSSGAEITLFEWDFGDDSEPAEGAVVEHSFEAAGTYDVILTITDANSQTAIASIQITIK